MNGTQDLSLVRNEKQLVFAGEFSAVGDKKVISYDVTNASQNYDAEILIDCTESTTYLNITNVFDMKNALSARSSRTGTLTIELSTAVSEEVSQDVTCTITANAVERDGLGSGDVGEPLEKLIPVGTELIYKGELFNVIHDNGNYVTLLARYNLDSTYKQSTTTNYVSFSGASGWEYTPGPKEIDIQTWSTKPKTYVNEYVSYLQEDTGDTTLTGDLITMAQLGELGCTVPSVYTWVSDSNARTCANSSHSDWLINGQYWWTRSTISGYPHFIWIMYDGGDLGNYSYYSTCGVRPVITLSRDTFEKMNNAANDVCVSEGYLYGEDTGSEYKCYFELNDQLLYCTYYYDGEATGGCSSPSPV